MEIEDSVEDEVMCSICTYIADNDDALNMVEGERVYVIGKKIRIFRCIKLHLSIFQNDITRIGGL